MPAPRNLVNLNAVAKGYGSRAVLHDITLGISSGERIGVVGQNGGGKSTLLRLIAGVEQPDGGALIRAGDVGVALLGQRDDLDEQRTIRELLVGERADHEWAGDSAFRNVLDGLLGGVELRLFANGMETPIAGLSGGERRRIALARLLLDPPELLLLDEPTNHLDVEGVDWLAHHLAARRGAMLVVTHDRWFLDAVCTDTWEVADGEVHQYEGGYAAYVLARAERERQEASAASRRRQLLRKELAWLRRGPPARTTKPKFRIDAANALIADEPPARDRAELLRFAGARLGNKVLEAVDVSLTFGTRQVLHDVTWRLGPGDRVARRRRQRLGQDLARAAALGRARAELGPCRARLDRAARLPLPGRSRDPRPPARARIARGGARPRDAQQRRRDHGRDAVRAIRLSRREGAHARRRPLRRRAPTPGADAPADGRAQRAAARRAHQRPRHRHADGARGPARRLARHARRRQPRPLLRRARLRRRLRAHAGPAESATSRAGSTSTWSSGALSSSTGPRRRLRARTAKRPGRGCAPSARRPSAPNARSSGWKPRSSASPSARWV